MAFRSYQQNIYDAVISKKNWGGSNVVVLTEDNITKVYFYGNKIAVVNHTTKTATYDNCGYNNACTNARINAVKAACDELGYK
jgi:hypothetical protein